MGERYERTLELEQTRLDREQRNLVDLSVILVGLQTRPLQDLMRHH